MMNKRVALLIVAVLAVSSLTMVESAFAQSIPKPSVPEFTLKLVDDSYDVPPTTKVNPYTGKTETSGGYHVQGYIEVHITIRNQPLTSLFYQVQTKGHFSQDWKTIEYWIGEAGSYNPRTSHKEQDYTSKYTILKYFDNGNLPREGLIDFRVQALIGFPEIHSTSDHIDLYNMWASFSFNGTASDWSNTQTVNMSDGAVIQSPSSPSPTSIPEQTTEPAPEDSTSPTSTPEQTTEPTPSQTTEPTTTNENPPTLQFAAIIGTVIAVVVVSAGLLIYLTKRKRQAP
jgi:hypothetical protein